MTLTVGLLAATPARLVVFPPDIPGIKVLVIPSVRTATHVLPVVEVSGERESCESWNVYIVGLSFMKQY